MSLERPKNRSNSIFRTNGVMSGLPWRIKALALDFTGFLVSQATVAFREKLLVPVSKRKLKIQWWQHRAGSTPATGTSSRKTPKRLI